MISIVVAISKNRAIGKDNKLLWKLSSDLKRFKNLTSGSIVIMGRKTYESIGKPLPNRRNIIISRNEDYQAEGCEIVSSLEEALLISGENCFIIGGGEIYKQSMGIAHKIYLTLVDVDLEGDTFFPEIDNTWFELSKSEYQADDKNDYNYSFIEYEKYHF